MEIIFRHSQDIIRKMPEMLAQRITECYYESGLTPSIVHASKYPQEVMLRKLRNTKITATHARIIISFLNEFTQTILSEQQRILHKILQDSSQTTAQILGKITFLLDDLFGRLVDSYPMFFREKLKKLN